MSSNPELVVRVVTNEQVKVSASSRISACRTGGDDEHEFFFELPAGLDVHRPLTVKIDDSTVELPVR
ncbi:MAG: hypothetical protein WKF57_00320 [Nakamurella sp.]